MSTFIEGLITMSKLTKRSVDATEPQTSEYFVWDSEIPGFGLRVLPSGRKGYVVQYRVGKRSRRISLGPCSVLTCEQARNRAIAVIATAKQGKDPAAKRDATRNAITVKDLAERFDREHIAIRVKASTAKEYRRNLSRFILPALGRLSVTDISRADVAKFHHDLRHIPYQANRCLEVVSKIFNLAEMWGLRPDGTNPRKHIRKYPEEKRERFLSAAELRRVGEVLREMEDEGIELPSAKALKILWKASALTHRRNRLNTEFYLPNCSGRSRHGQPVRAIHSTASTNSRGLGPVRPGSHSRPRQCGAMSAHCVSVKVIRIKIASYLATLNHHIADLGILKRQQTLVDRQL